MTDRELLEDCLEAFDALIDAKSARKLLKKWGQTPGAYAGTGQYLLAIYLTKTIRAHLAEKPTLTLDALEKMTAR